MPIESVKCPTCGGPMISRRGRFGVFWGCTKFPACKGTRDANGDSPEDRLREHDQDQRQRGRWRDEWRVDE